MPKKAIPVKPMQEKAIHQIRLLSKAMLEKATHQITQYITKEMNLVLIIFEEERHIIIILKHHLQFHRRALKVIRTRKQK